MRYLITVSYDGTLFAGYQKQPKQRTVQGEIEKALKEISGGKKIDMLREELMLEFMLLIRRYILTWILK